ncbi:MAG: glycosyltransferase [Myxococcota bacterium]
MSVLVVILDAPVDLPAAIASARPVADQILVLDAVGGLPLDFDDVEILSHDFVDLSTAWNAARERAEGDWILMLDADQQLHADAAEIIRAAIAADDLDCGMLPERSSPTHQAQWRPRLLRNTEDLRWESAVHDVPQAWMDADGRRVRDIAAEIIRAPRAGEIIPRRHTGAAYSALLRQRVAESPDDLDAWVALGHEQVVTGALDEAQVSLEAAWALLEHHPQRQHRALPVTLKAWALLQRNKQIPAIETLSAAAGWGMMHPNITLLQGIALENLAARAPEAQQAQLYQQALTALKLGPTMKGQRFTSPVIDGATGWLADVRLGATLQALGRPREARPAFERALQVHDTLLEARLGLAETLIDTDPDRALELVDPIVTSAGVDGWLLKAAAHEARDEDPEMARALFAGLQKIKEGFQARHRRALMDELVGLLGILQGAPRSGRGAMGALGGLMTGYPPPSTASYPAPIGSANARRLAKVIGYLEAQGEGTLLQALRAPPVERLFPGISQLLAEA